MTSVRRLCVVWCRAVAFLWRLLHRREACVRWLRRSYELQGIVFTGEPRYIDASVRLDGLGGLTIGEGVVMSVDVLVLTHDYSITTGLSAAGVLLKTDIAVRAPVRIGTKCFLGARSVILPGTVLGDHVIVGAGAVVRGVIASDSILVGNPAVVVKRASEWALAKRNKMPADQMHEDLR